MHVAIFFQPRLNACSPFPERGLAIARCVLPRVPVQADVNQIGCHFVPHWPVGRVGHADGDCAALEAFGYFVIEPRLVTKLDRVSRAFPALQIFYKLLQPLDVLFQRRRKLPDHSGEAFAKGRCRFTTTNHRILHVEQLFVVRDVTVAFDGKSKSIRCLVAPFPERAFLLEPVERAVDLDCSKTFRAEAKPLFLRLIAVETDAPAFVIPAAGADVRFARHCFPLKLSAERLQARAITIGRVIALR